MKESMEEWLYFNNVKYTVEKNTKPSAKVAQELYSLSSASNLSSNDASSNQTPSQSVGDGNVSAPANPEVPVSPAAPVTPPEAPASSAAAPVTLEVPVSPVASVAPVTPEAPVAPASSAAAPVTPEVPVSPVASVAPVTPTDAPVSPASVAPVSAPDATVSPPASVAPVSAPIAPAGNVGAYLREHSGNNGNTGVIDPSGASWRNNYGQVAPGFFNKPVVSAGDNTTGSNQTVPPNNGFNRYNQGIIDPSGASWRGNYGQVAPGFFHKSGAASAGTSSSSNNPANPVIPQGGDGSQAAAPYNPNQNGDSSNGPAWKPRISSPGWSAPQPHTADSGSNQAQQKQFSVANALLNASLVPRTSYAGNLFAGGVGGVLGAGPLPWTLNKVVDFTVNHTKEGGKVNDAASYVQEKLNPKVFTKAKFTTVTSKIAELDKTINNIKAGTNNEILNLKQISPDELTAEQAARVDLLDTKLTLLNDMNFTNADSAAKQLKLINDSSKLVPDMFTKDELAALKSRVDLKVEADSLAGGFKDSTSFLGASSIKGLAGNFIKGAAFAGLAMTADDYIDRLVFHKDHQEASALYNGLLLPAAFAGPTWGSRITLAGAGIAGSIIADKLLPKSSQQEFSKLLRPTTLDSVLMGAAFLIPTESNMVRASLVGGAWAIGRVYNLIEGDGQISQKNDAIASLKTDAADRTYSSMQNSINAFKSLGDTSLPAVNLEVQELNANQSNDLDVLRQQSIVDAAYGESLLKHGSLVPGAKTPQYLLPGYNLDFGGRAMRYLMLAQNKLQTAQKVAKLELGQTVDGKVVTQSEINGLAKEESNVTDIINNKINGKHDVNAIFNKLENLAYLHPGEAAKLIQKNQNWIAKLGHVEPALSAKLFRDLALVELAAAAKDIGYNGIGKAYNGSDAEAALAIYGSNEARQTADANGNPRGYSGALDCIKLATQLDPNNPDLPAIIAIANELKAKVPSDAVANLHTTLSNPF